MAENKLKKRVRKAVRKELRRRERQRPPAGPGRGPGPSEPWFPGNQFGWPDEGRDDDVDGGAGVREPRHPWPTTPAAALALEEPEPQYLDLTR